MRNNTSARNRIKIQNAVMEIMERRTLFTAAPITLDPAFGTDGEVSQILTPAGTGQLTATNPLNGNVFVVGVNQDTQTISSPYNIEEFTSAGTIIPSFGNDGLAAGSVHDAVPLAQETPVAAAVQSDGKLLVLSANIPTYEIQELYLTRYTTAGLPDPTFGTDGTLVYGTSYSPFFGPGETFHLMPNGNIAILGSIVGNNGSITSSVTMFTSAGVLDKSFGTNGVATGIAGSIDNLSVDSSGNLIAVGFVANITPYSDSPNVGLVERFTPAGKLDTTFGNAGSLVAPNASAFVTAYIGSTGITVSGYPPASSSAALELNQYTLSGKPIGSGSV